MRLVTGRLPPVVRLALHQTRWALHQTRQGLHRTRQDLQQTRQGLHQTRQGLHQTRQGLHRTRQGLAQKGAVTLDRGLALYSKGASVRRRRSTTPLTVNASSTNIVCIHLAVKQPCAVQQETHTSGFAVGEPVLFALIFLTSLQERAAGVRTCLASAKSSNGLSFLSMRSWCLIDTGS